MLRICFIYLSLLLILDNGALINPRIIKTRLGLIEGVLKVARNQEYFHAYYGIPYGRAPVGELRFEPPIEADGWKGVLNATRSPPFCPQISEKSDVYTGEEDCLTVNVFTPLIAKPGSNIPVLFYIFGGEFRYGGPAREGPEFIMSRNIILVMANFRLGVMGFLSTGDTILPGNMALKDQVLAMKWTKRNIYDFGGDPHRITIHGHSSGAICVHLHTISPLSQDYFNQAIMQSGVSTSPQSFWNRDKARCIAFNFAEKVNCATNTSESLKKCLQRKKAKKLVEAANELFMWNFSNTPAVFKPVIEEKHVENGFMTENPILASYVSHEKPWLLGMTSDESSESVRNWVVNKPGIFDIDPRLWLPLVTSIQWTSKPNHIDFVVQKAKTRFFGNEQISTDTASNLVKLLSGISYGYGLTNAVQKYQAVKYLYLYNYRYAGKLGSNTPFLGVGHASELAIIFNRTDGAGIAEEDWAFGDEMITRWVNFAYSGNPNVPFPINTNIFGPWMPISTPRLEFLRLTRNGSMERDYFSERYDFWKKIPLFSDYF